MKIGQTVQYWSRVKWAGPIVPSAAIIVGINEDETVNLRVFYNDGGIRFLKSVKAVQYCFGRSKEKKLNRWEFI